MTDPMPWALLLVWGAVVGVDLVSVLQGLLSRPLVAATGAGLIVGDPAMGLAIGTVLELFALDVVPIGASRYPEFGPAGIAAVAAVAGTPVAGGLGVGVVLALALGVFSGRTMHVLRRLNGAVTRRAAPALARGEPGAVARVQLFGVTADLLRAVLVTGLGLALAWLLRSGVTLPGDLARNLGLIAVSGGLIAAVHGGLQRAAGRAFRIGVVGLAAGVAVAWLF